MDLPSGVKCPSSPEGLFVARQPKEWFKKKNYRPCPSELITFHCPYSLRKTAQFQFRSRLWTVGDIALVGEPDKMAFAQILELYENDFCEKRAKVIWLAPKLDIINYTSFKANDYMHVKIDKRLVPIECLTFIMRVPNNCEYKKHIGTDYLVNTQIISHSERYTQSNAVAGPKSKSKVRRLLNK